MTEAVPPNKKFLTACFRGHAATHNTDVKPQKAGRIPFQCAAAGGLRDVTWLRRNRNIGRNGTVGRHSKQRGRRRRDRRRLKRPPKRSVRARDDTRDQIRVVWYLVKN